MKRHVFVGKCGPDDTISVSRSSDQVITKLEFLSSDGKLNYGIDQALEDLKRKSIFPLSIGIDLLILAAHVQAADTHISRKSESQNSWTREIKLVVPVSDPLLWNKAVPTLARLLNFLSGDFWLVEFRSRPTSLSNAIPTGTPPLTSLPYDSLSLFSGGLDSLIGAIDSLENRKSPFSLAMLAKELQAMPRLDASKS